MREYHLSEEPSAWARRDNTFLHRNYWVSGSFPDYDLMTDNERIAYLKQGKPHIAFIRAMPLADQFRYREHLMGKPIECRSMFNEINGLSGKTREQVRIDLEDALRRMKGLFS